MEKLKIGVIFGGTSTEHNVSLVSGTSIIKNLNKEKYNVLPIYISRSNEWFKYTKPVEEIDVLPFGQEIMQLKKIQDPLEYINNLDIAFPVLHGLYGEDGTIQGMLELLDKKYVGCKVLASSVCMDKAYAKVIFERANINQADYVYIRKNKEKYIYVNKDFSEQEYNIEDVCKKTEERLGFPVFVKPSNSGSSVGINKSHNLDELKEHIEYASKFDRKILIEQNIDGREVECAVLGNEDVKASCVGEILPAEEFYTFDAKYTNAQSRVLIPADLPKEIEDEIRQTAIKAFKAVNGSGLSRVDFFVEKGSNKVIINEINTLPGFTQISMYPKLWEQMGLTYSELLDELIKLANE